MGLGKSSDTRGNIPNLIDWSFNSKHINKQEFSLCLAMNGGFLTIGGPTSHTHLPD